MLIDPKFYVMAEKIRSEWPKGEVEDWASLPKLGAVVSMAGDGDHLDIGTGYGASAIMAAMVKQEFTLAGQVWCVDPYLKDGQVDTSMIETLNDTAGHFGVADKLVLTIQSSYPLPNQIKEKNFVSCYLDGSKDGMNPWLDFLSVRLITKKFVMFAGFEEFYPGVMVAAARALTVGGWILHYKDGSFFSLRVPVDFSGWQKLSDEDKAKRRQGSQV